MVGNITGHCEQNYSKAVEIMQEKDTNFCTNVIDKSTRNCKKNHCMQNIVQILQEIKLLFSDLSVIETT